MEGDAVKNLWQLEPSRNTSGDEFQPNMSFTMNVKSFLDHKLVNKCKSRGKKRFITTIACSSA